MEGITIIVVVQRSVDWREFVYTIRSRLITHYHINVFVDCAYINEQEMKIPIPILHRGMNDINHVPVIVWPACY